MEFWDNAVSRRRILTSGSALVLGSFLNGARTSSARAAAPLLGPSQPTHYRFKLGAMEITTILDANAFIDGPWPLFGKNGSQQEVDKLMRDNFLPTNKYQPGFTPTIINTGSELILIDTGNGANGFVPRPQGGWLAAQLGPAGFKPDEFDLIVLSHGHPDHVGGFIEDGKPLFPNARYAINGVEYDFWSPEGKHVGDLETFAAVFRSNIVPSAEKFRFLKPGEDVAPGIRAMETYGHTPGHLSFHIESEGKSLFFLGDCAHHHVASLAMPSWHCVFDVDQEKAAATRARVFDMLATDCIPVAAYHMPFPSLGYIERRGTSGYRWVPHSYQLNL
jgi:glyoxylase-like metal-dependent hydrolase (beta-lactamase superfamily II)